MNPPDLPPAPDPASWRKKRRIWIANIVASSLVLLVIPSLVIGITTYMSRDLAGFGKSGTDVNQLGEHINRTMAVMSVGWMAGLLAIIWLGVSITMFCLVPKPFNGMIR